MFFQADFLPTNPIKDVNLEVNTPTFSNIINSPYFIPTIFGIGVIVLLLITYFILRKFLYTQTMTKTSFEKIVLLVKVPKESPEKEEMRKTAKELILPMERLFDNIAGLRAQKGLRSKIFGRTDHFSFEIVADKDGIISFYIVVPRYLRQFFEQQIQAQFPAAQIDEVSDYNIFSPKGITISAILKLKKKFIFPIKTYVSLETDPLLALINSLSKIEKGESAAVQIVARSAYSRWHKLGALVASKIQQGKKLSEAMAEVFGGGLGHLFKTLIPKSETKKEEFKKPHQLSPMEQEIVKKLEEKTSKAGLDVNIRVVVTAENLIKAKSRLQNILNSFAQFTSYEYLNGFKSVYFGQSPRVIRDFIYRNFDERNAFVLNAEEMASIFHFPLPQTQTPNIRWLLSKKAAAPVGIPSEGLILGKNIYRGQEKLIRIKKEDRRRHIYIIGKTGTGKSWLIGNMAMQDVINGAGIAVIDPHGDLVERILNHIPKERVEDVIYFNPADTERPIGLNLLEYDPKYPEQKTFVINEMIKIMDKLYDLRQTGGPMFEQYMRNAMLLVMEHPESGATLMEIPKVLSDASFRHYKLDRCHNPVVRDFWIKEAEKAGGEAALSNMTPYITSKLNQFVANDIMRPIIGQQVSALNFRKAMDEGKIILINLSKGLIGDLNAYLLGLVIVGKITMAALSRADLPEEERKDFYLYIDEFQNFITDTISVILSEARKYRLCLNIAHQYIGQLVKGNDTQIRDAVLGTVGTMLVFKIGIEDAQFIAKEFAPVFNEYDLINIEKYNCYVKLLVDNQATRPFNMQTLQKVPGIPEPNPELAKKIKELSRLKYGRPKNEVEQEIVNRVKEITSKIEEEEEEIGESLR